MQRVDDQPLGARIVVLETGLLKLNEETKNRLTITVSQ